MLNSGFLTGSERGNLVIIPVKLIFEHCPVTNPQLKCKLDQGCSPESRSRETSNRTRGLLQKHNCTGYSSAEFPISDLPFATFSRTDAVPQFVHRWRCRYLPSRGCVSPVMTTSSHSCPNSRITGHATAPRNEVILYYA